MITFGGAVVGLIELRCVDFGAVDFVNKFKVEDGTTGGLIVGGSGC